MKKFAFELASVLVPKNCDMTKWSVVACDQYTSEPEYWDKVEKFVGEWPSTYSMIIPEIFLEDDDILERIKGVNDSMDFYLKNEIFDVAEGFIYVERTQKNGKTRKGIVGVVDLEEYDFSKGSTSLIRATEGTVLERIPPRVRVRKNASLELPHVMVLIDDDKKNIIEPLEGKKHKYKKLYDFELMMDSGSITGYLVDKSDCDAIVDSLIALSNQDLFEEKYHVKGLSPVVFAMGDGNHSLATAKTCYEAMKSSLPKEVYESHPARYALVELVNLHDNSLEFEAIHRVVFDVDVDHFFCELEKFYDVSYEAVDNAQSFSYITNDERGEIYIKNPTSHLVVGTLQNFIDEFLQHSDGKVDYIHGDDVVEKFSLLENNIGFILPCMEKSQLFETVILDGVLPRKTFSMGHAEDKRFYLECRKIK